MDVVDVRQAYADAVEQAHFEHGYGEYTGTIVEKEGFVVIDRTPIPYTDAITTADHLIDVGDPRIEDKWRPAGAIRIKDAQHDGWLFFGWAAT